MDSIEKKLLSHKKAVDDLETPADLEDKLLHRLHDAPKRKSPLAQTMTKIAIIALFILVGLVGYNHNALAYYSKKILGFENYLFGTLGTLNEDEKGQVIGKTVELEEGMSFTINGIMTDPNQLVMFYTFTAQEGMNEFDPNYSLGSISGFMTNANSHGGVSYQSDDGTSIKGIANFDPVNPMAQKLTLYLWNWEDEDVIEITFPHDPNKAMKASVDTAINQTIPLDKGTITFDSITATPTMTLLKGTIDIAGHDHPMDAFIGIKILGNELTVGRKRTSTTTEDDKPTTFEIVYGALPEDLDSLQVYLNKFIGYKEVHDKISLDESVLEKEINFHGQEIVIEKMEKQSDQFKITISAEENVLFDGLAIETDGMRTEMKEMTMGNYKMKNKMERTYTFDTEEIPTSLAIDGMYYLKTYDEKINIPIQ